MAGLDKDIFGFLKDLSKNNTKSWFDENRVRYKCLRDSIKAFAEELLLIMGIFDRVLIDEEVTPYIFRINRDTRFSKNKRPYKTNFGVMILPGGRKAMHERAGYYLHFEPGNCFLGGGAYLPPSKWIGQIRDKIVAKPKDFKKIIDGSQFKKYFELRGAQLKTAPRGYDKEHPEIELLRYKSFMGICNLTDKQVLSRGFMKYAHDAFKALYPFDQFLNRK